jgi:hypothetical protein
MKKVIFVIFIIIVLGVGWYLLSPFFIDKTVDEAFPEVSVPLVIPTEEEMLEMSDEELEKIKTEIMDTAAEEPDKVMEEPMPEPKKISQGLFSGADAFHLGSGSAGIYELADGSKVLRFENFSVVNGPDLRVLLAEHPNPVNRDDVQVGYIELAKLKGNKGNQNYGISNDIDVEKYKSVVIYCKPFHVLFSTASLAFNR